jgi:hypothetical protein
LVICQNHRRWLLNSDPIYQHSLNVINIIKSTNHTQRVTQQRVIVKAKRRSPHVEGTTTTTTTTAIPSSTTMITTQPHVPTTHMRCSANGNGMPCQREYKRLECLRCNQPPLVCSDLVQQLFDAIYMCYHSGQNGFDATMKQLRDIIETIHHDPIIGQSTKRASITSSNISCDQCHWYTHALFTIKLYLRKAPN